MSNAKTKKITDKTILTYLISILPFSIQSALDNDMDYTSMDMVMEMCLGLSAKLGGDTDKQLRDIFNEFNLNEITDVDALVADINKKIMESSYKDLIDVSDDIVGAINIKIPKNKVPSKRNDKNLTNSFISKACSLILTTIIDLGIALNVGNKDDKDPEEVKSRVIGDCKLNIVLVLGLVDKLGMKPEDAISIAATEALVITENDKDEHKLPKETIDDLITNLSAYLPSTLSGCAAAVDDMVS